MPPEAAHNTVVVGHDGRDQSDDALALAAVLARPLDARIVIARVYPNGERKFFFLILFAPSMVYWPSSIGKEAVVIFGVGLTTYGLAR